MPKKPKKKCFRPRSRYKDGKKSIAVADHGADGADSPASPPPGPVDVEDQSSASAGAAGAEVENSFHPTIDDPSVHGSVPEVLVIQLPEVSHCMASSRNIDNDHTYCQRSASQQTQPSESFDVVNHSVENDTVNVVVEISSSSPPTHVSNKVSSASFTGVLGKLKEQLPSLWIPVVSEHGLSILKVSDSAAPVTQRSVTINFSGDVTYFVHGRELPRIHNVYNDSPKCVDIGSEERILSCVKSCVSVFRQFEICCGVTNLKYKPFWKSTEKTVIDKNDFKEVRYSETLRSNSCLFLVNQPKRMCGFCFNLSKGLCSRSKSFRNNLSPTSKRQKTPSKYKPWKSLITPERMARQARYQKTIKNLTRENARLRAKLANVIERDGVCITNKKQSSEFKDLMEKAKNTSTDPLHRLFLEQQLQALNLKNLKNMKWHPMIIRLALRIKMISAAAYKELANSGFVVLPSERTLFDYSHIMDLKDGIHKPILNDIAQKLNGLEHEYQRYHTLMFDEVYINQHLVYKKSTGEIIGYTKLSEVQQELLEMERVIKETAEEAPVQQPTAPPIAKRILSYMVKGVSSSVRGVIASFAVSNLSKEDLMDYTWDVIESCEVKDIRIAALVCDGSPINRSFIDMHPPATKLKSGVVFDTINVYASERNIYFFSDLPHLAKTARNCLYNSGRKNCRRMFKNGEFLTWNSIVRLFNEKKSETVTKLHKLNAGSVFLNSYSRMNVSYAMRVLSASVANALKQKKWEGCNELPIFANF